VPLRRLTGALAAQGSSCPRPALRTPPRRA
jgi:hypothetical protein